MSDLLNCNRMTIINTFYVFVKFVNTTLHICIYKIYNPTIFHLDLLFSLREHLAFYVMNDKSQGVFLNLKSKRLRILNSLY